MARTSEVRQGVARLLARAVATAGERVQITKDALEPVEADRADGEAWLGAALALAERSRTADLALCVTLPPPARREPAALSVVRGIVQRQLATLPRVTTVDGPRWTATPSTASCPRPLGVVNEGP